MSKKESSWEKGRGARTPLERHPAKDEPAGEKTKSKPVKRASSGCTKRISPAAGEKATWGDVSVGVRRETRSTTLSQEDGKVSLVQQMRTGGLGGGKEMWELRPEVDR